MEDDKELSIGLALSKMDLFLINMCISRLRKDETFKYKNDVQDLSKRLPLQLFFDLPEEVKFFSNWND